MAPTHPTNPKDNEMVVTNFPRDSPEEDVERTKISMKAITTNDPTSFGIVKFSSQQDRRKFEEYLRDHPDAMASEKTTRWQRRDLR